MKTIVFFLLLAVAPLALVAQAIKEPPVGGPPTTEPEKQVLTYVEQMPEFSGGQPALLAYLQKNIRYPDDAREQGIQGKVFLSFVVDETGRVKDVKVKKGVYPSIDKEALRVVKAMPLWKPGIHNGKPVNVQFNLPISFKLQ